jgi:hypothetical protein
MSPNPRPVPRPEDIIREQGRQAAAAKAPAVAIPKPFVSLQQATEKATAVIPAKSTAVALPDNRSAAEQYVDQVAPAMMAGRLIKFTKEGVFATADDGEQVSQDDDFIALVDETLVGWIKFNGEGNPPDRHMGLLYDGFVMPPRETLGDTDETQWEAGLSGQPADPWQHQQCLVLQHSETKELFTYATSSLTGRRAIGNLLRHYNRMLKTGKSEVPIVRLKLGGFNHRDTRVGWVSVPVFAVVGRTARENAAKPDTSIAADMNDAIPF